MVKQPVQSFVLGKHRTCVHNYCAKVLRFLYNVLFSICNSLFPPHPPTPSHTLTHTHPPLTPPLPLSHTHPPLTPPLPPLTHPPGVFALLHAFALLKYLQSRLTGRQFRTLFFSSLVVSAAVVFVAVVTLTYMGYVAPWSGRFYSLYDTG